MDPRIASFGIVAVAGSTVRANVSSSGEEANAPAEYGGALSADGRFVAFMTFAGILIAGDTNGA